jgi:hypothetical protein
MFLIQLILTSSLCAVQGDDGSPWQNLPSLWCPLGRFPDLIHFRRDLASATLAAHTVPSPPRGFAELPRVRLTSTVLGADHPTPDILDLRPLTNTSYTTKAACACRPHCPATTATAPSSAQNFPNRITHRYTPGASQLNSSLRRSEPNPRQERTAGEWTGTDSNACLSVRGDVVRHLS